MTAAPNPYAPDAVQQAENERVVRLAVHLINASYAAEKRPMNAALRDQMRRADRCARGLAEWNRKRARA